MPAAPLVDEVVRAQLRRAMPRRTRRLARAPHGERIDLRAILRRSVRAAALPPDGSAGTPMSRLAHRVVPVAPRRAAFGLAPRTGGMAAALPCCDAFASGPGVAAPGEVLEAIADPDPTAPRRTTT